MLTAMAPPLLHGSIDLTRNYVTIMRDARTDERVHDDSCQPRFYILGAMKAASTQLATMLRLFPGVTVHPWE